MFRRLSTKWYRAREMWRRFINEKQSCPVNDGRYFTPKGKDYWRKQGKDRVCSYCGSWHPEEFMEHVRKVIEVDGDGLSVELNDYRNKIYVTRPGVSNAGQGAIKFYLYHRLPQHRNDECLKLINEALRISWQRFQEKFKHNMEVKNQGGNHEPKTKQ